MRAGLAVLIAAGIAAFGAIGNGAAEQASPEPASGSQYEPAIAFGSTSSLVVWTNYQFRGQARRLRARGASPLDPPPPPPPPVPPPPPPPPPMQTRGTRWGRGGAVLDPGGLEISKDANSAQQPAIAFGAGLFLVAWADWKDGRPVIYGTRVTQTGVVLDPNAIRIGPAVQGESPAVAFDGHNFLVVSQRYRPTYPAYGTVYGARVTPGGTVLDPDGFQISDVGFSPDVAFDGANYLVVWSTDFSDGHIVGARVSPEGTVLDPTGVPISSLTHESQPSVAFDGVNYLVVWTDGRSGFYVYGARVAPSGNLLDPRGIKLSSASGSRPDVAFGGANYLVLWDTAAAACCAMHGTRVSPSGNVLDPSGITVPRAAVSSDVQPAIAFDGTNFGVAWTDTGSADVYGARVDPSGVVRDPALGILLSRASTPPPVRCRVPRVVGLRLAAAKSKLRRAHCAVGTVRRKRSARAGVVLSQKPRARSIRPRGSRVTLVVGRRTR